MLGPHTLMVVALERPVAADEGAGADPRAPRSRIAVVGDSDFATNSFFHVMGNGTLFLNTINYLAAQENLIGIQPRTHDLPRDQPHESTDEGHLPPLRGPRARAPRRRRHRGLVEAAVRRRPDAAAPARLVVWAVLAALVAVHRG